MAGIDGKGLAQAAWTGAEKCIAIHPTSRPHDLDAMGRLDGADQHGTAGCADHVEAPVQPVGTVYIGMSRRAEHRPVAHGLAAKTVRRGIVALIGLGLHDHTANAFNKKARADQGGCHCRGRPVEEGCRGDRHGGSLLLKREER